MKRLLLLLSFVFMACSLNAQNYLGISTSNWSGTSALYLNPANVADNRDRMAIDIIGFNAGVDNNLGKLNSIGGINKFLNGSNSNVNDVFSFTNNSKFSLLAPYAEIRGPGIMLSKGRWFNVALTTRIRGINQFNNFDQTLYRTITDSSYTANGNVNLTAQNFNWTGHLWSEAAFTYGAVVLQKGQHELKVGGTIRYLGGIGYVSLKGHNLDAHYTNGSDSFYASNTDLEYGSNVLSARSALLTDNNYFDAFFGKKGGNGVGGDIGVVYDYITDSVSDRYDMDGRSGIPDQSKNRYKLRFSASVTDLGHITYKGSDNYGVSVSGGGSITGQGLSNNVNNFNSFKNYVQTRGFNVDTGQITSKLYMPAKLMLSADYNAWKWLYINAMYLNNLANRNNYGNSFYNQITVTPRFDVRRMSIALPITYSFLARDFKTGLGVRYNGFYIGSDDMLVLFSRKQYGLNMYVGGYVPFIKYKPKDRDGDHVSDRRDRCPDEYGTWENRGCPETDKQRRKREAADTTDNCPEASGLAPMDELQVVKDTDGDGIPDDEDACPTVAGVASNHGCPEKQVEKKLTNLNEATLPMYNNKAGIMEADYPVLDRFVKLLKEYPGEKLTVEGYSSEVKSKMHTALAHKQAEKVKEYFVVNGIAAGRITTKTPESGKPGSGSANKHWVVIRRCK